MKRLLIMVFLLGISSAYPQGRLIENPLKDLPKWVRTEFNSRHLEEKYTIVYRLYPHVLYGDFNGDGKRDAIIQLQERSTGKLGVAIFHAKKAQALYVPVTILGAGRTMANAGDDFKWANFWSVRKQGADPSRGDGLTIGKRGGRTGLITWDGSKYSWQRLSR